MIEFIRPIGHAARDPSRSVLEHNFNMVVIRSRAHNGKNILVVQILAVVVWIVVMVVRKVGMMMMVVWDAIVFAPDQEKIVLSEVRLRIEHAWERLG